MTRKDFAKCVEALQTIRQCIKGKRTAEELTQDETASAAYSMTIDLEDLLDSMTPPWED